MITIDARGKACPMPIVLLAKGMRDLASGTTVTIRADDRAFPLDIEAWCQKTKNELVSLADSDGQYAAVVRKG